MDTETWYASLRKPWWILSQQNIRLIWNIFYPILYIANIGIFYKLFFHDILIWEAVPFWLNLVVTFLFTPIQMRYHNLWLAAMDIAVVWLTIIWCMATIRPYSHDITNFYTVYLVWVSMLGAMQLTLTILNVRSKPKTASSYGLIQQPFSLR
jgi:benzodiazapine receptor